MALVAPGVAEVIGVGITTGGGIAAVAAVATVAAVTALTATEDGNGGNAAAVGTGKGNATALSSPDKEFEGNGALGVESC